MPETKGPSKWDTLRGGVTIHVAYLDGTAEDVFVRQVAIRDCDQYLMLQQDESGMVEFLCRRPTGWADGLTAESHEGIMAAGDILNADFFGRWLRRRMDRIEKMQPGLMHAMVRSVAEQAQPNTSPTSPSSAA